MKHSLSFTSGAILVAAFVSTGVAGWSALRLFAVRDAVEVALQDSAELVAVRDEIDRLKTIQDAARLKILSGDELRAIVMSVVQGVQPASGASTFIEVGRENRVGKLDIIHRQSQIKVGAMTLRECKELLKTLKQRLPSARIAEIGLTGSESAGVSSAETWTLELRLEEFRYAPSSPRD